MSTPTAEQWRQLVEQLPDAVALIDDRAHVLLANAECRRLLGARGPEDFDCLKRVLGEALQGRLLRSLKLDGEVAMDVRVPVSPRQPELHLRIEATAGPIEDGYRLILRDMTAQVRWRQASERLAERERLLLEYAPIMVAYYQEPLGVCMFANWRFAHLFGRNVVDVVGRGYAELGAPEIVDALLPAVESIAAGESSADIECILHRDGEADRVISVHLVRHADDDDRCLGVMLLMNDITDFREAELALRRSQERLQQFMEVTNEGIAFHAPDGQVLDVNPALARLLGYEVQDLLGRAGQEFIAGRDLDEIERVIARGRAESAIRIHVLHRDGSEVPLEVVGRHIHLDGNLARVSVVRDLRPRLDAERRMRELANTDALTGLLNRRAFFEKLPARLTRLAARNETAALLFLDLDRFKQINDQLGHSRGDVVLQAVGHTLKAMIGEDDLAGRFGGDEFVLLLSSVGRDAAPLRARHVLDAIAQVLEGLGVGDIAHASVGVSLFPDDGANADTLLHHADTAMYRAKTTGGAGVELHDRFA